jgi:hypothetical protein
MEIKEEKPDLVLAVAEEVLEDGYEDDDAFSLPLLFNYTNIYILPLTIIFTCFYNLIIFSTLLTKFII